MADSTSAYPAPFDLLEQSLFQREVFGGGFDHPVGVGDRGVEGRVDRDPGERRTIEVEAGEVGGDPLQDLAAGVGVRVGDPHRVA
jgi:hypothetical protein